MDLVIVRTMANHVSFSVEKNVRKSCFRVGLVGEVSFNGREGTKLGTPVSIKVAGEAAVIIWL